MLRSVSTNIWSDPWFETLNPGEKLLWLWLITNSATNMLGIYETSVQRACFETGLKQTEVEKSLKTFAGVGKAHVIGSYIYMVNHAKNNSLNSNMRKSAETAFDKLPPYVKNWLQEKKEIQNYQDIVDACYNQSDDVQQVYEAQQKKKPRSKAVQKTSSKASLPERREQFIKQLEPYQEKYGSAMLNEFYTYWSEESAKQKGKMHFETMDKWELGMRLARWKINSKKIEKSKQANAKQSRSSKLSSVAERLSEVDA